jgi:PQQ enzyme repeat
MKNVYSCLIRQGCYLVAVCVASCALLTAQIAVATYHNDNYRSGANAQETILTPSNVNVQSFGKRFTFSVQGYVYAQPLYVPGVVISGTAHNVVYIATEHDQVYAFDATSGQKLWQVNFLAGSNALTIISPVSSNDVNCGDLVPEIGITGTPAIDASANRLYVIAKTKVYDVRSHTTTFYQTLHVLDIRTGFETFPPQRISATFPGTGTGSVNGVLTFDPLVQSQRPGLLIQNGAVFAAFASHCDHGNYHGWIMAFAENTLLPSGVTVDTPNGYEGGYWGGGSGLNADAAGSIYGATGNGYFDVDQGGIDYGDSILRLTWSAASKTFTVADYFTPWDQLSLDHNDTDLGSGGIVLLPDQPGTKYPHLLVQVGKEGTIDLVNRDNMGHFHSGNDSQIVQTLPFAIGGIWGAPAFWNDNVYFGGYFDYLKAFAFDPNAQQLSMNYTSESPEFYGFPGPTPSVSANGNVDGIVWMIESDTYGFGGPAVLRAYDATNLGKELYNSEQNSGRDRVGLAVKFTTPTIADGLVFAGAENQVSVYGLLGQ